MLYVTENLKTLNLNNIPMTPNELKLYLQKEILQRRSPSTAYLCDSIGCTYHGLQSFLLRCNIPGEVSVALKVVCYLINEGVIELKGGVKNV